MKKLFWSKSTRIYFILINKPLWKECYTPMYWVLMGGANTHFIIPIHNVSYSNSQCVLSGLISFSFCFNFNLACESILKISCISLVPLPQRVCYSALQLFFELNSLQKNWTLLFEGGICLRGWSMPPLSVLGRSGSLRFVIESQTIRCWNPKPFFIEARNIKDKRPFKTKHCYSNQRQFLQEYQELFSCNLSSIRLQHEETITRLYIYKKRTKESIIITTKLISHYIQSNRSIIYTCCCSKGRKC
jgi:hypothetical protein